MLERALLVDLEKVGISNPYSIAIIGFSHAGFGQIRKQADG